MDKMTSRPIRNRKNSRKSWTNNGDAARPVKRLFTPEIKKLLKDWLVRRRDNPYPSRDEKKALAVETGLTYTQICNWFANWRRKLKNTSNQKKSWGNLIKNYNFSAKGNVEQFSICSADSIWGEEHAQSLGSSSVSQSNQESDSEPQDYSSHFDDQQKFNIMAHGPNFMLPSASPSLFNHQNSPFSGIMTQAQCFQITSTSNDFPFQHSFPPSNKFKNHIMEKYLRGLESNKEDCETSANIHENVTLPCPSTSNLGLNDKPELSKWLISTANFKPSNYNIDFMKNFDKKKNNNSNKTPSNQSIQEKELIAAETLVLLKNNFRTKFYNS